MDREGGEERIVVEVDRASSIATVSINRPKSLNSLTKAMITRLALAFSSLDADPSVGAVVLTGRGRAFCSGVDLTSAEDVFKGDVKDLDADPVHQMERCRKPIVGAINGFAVTAGFEIALACDVLVAAREAKFIDTHARFGIFPSWGLSQKLSRIIGPNRAREVSLTAMPVTAEMAERWGLVNYVVESEEVVSKAKEIARAMLRNNRDMVLKYKAVINDGLRLDLGNALSLEKMASGRGNFPVGSEAEDLQQQHAQLMTDMEQWLREEREHARLEREYAHEEREQARKLYEQMKGEDLTLREFLQHDPPIFYGEPELEKAEYWLKEIEFTFSALDCPEVEKVAFAISMLHDNAKDWWETCKGVHFKDDQEVAWKDFVQVFTDHFIPMHARLKKRQEFIDLQQSELSVDGYTAQFYHLEKYGKGICANEPERVKKYVMGLKIGLRAKVLGSMPKTLADAVHAAMVIDEEHQLTQSQLKRHNKWSGSSVASHDTFRSPYKKMKTC